MGGGTDAGLRIGSVLLMMLGTCWLLLFNVIAGAQAIPRELFDVDKVFGAGRRVQRWRKLILPAIFPHALTGLITAAGGAWNASIVSEYVSFQGGVLKTTGLGAMISSASVTGDYPLLLAATLVMALLVLLTNRLVWSPLANLANTKYAITTT